MSKISLAPDVAGTGIFTIASPNSNTNRTLTLPDDTGTIVTNSGNQAGSFTTLNTSGQVVFNDAGADVDFRVEGDTDANLLFVDASTDRVGIGTSSPGSLFEIKAATPVMRINGTTGFRGIEFQSSGSTFGSLKLDSSSGETALSAGENSSGFFLTFKTGNGTERMRIDSSGNLLVGKTSSSFTVAGTSLEPDGDAVFTRAGNRVIQVNRLTDDGDLVHFYQDSILEGTISVSGTAVSYNGGNLSRWAQLTTPKDDTPLFKGTVMSNLDEMNVYIAPTTYWTEEDELPVDEEGNPTVAVGDVKQETSVSDNEQLNKVKVSDVEGDANVAGVFVNWTYDEAHQVDEINMAMTGDMIIRIAEGVTVARGDLLMSAGDGTAKPQGDDIVRSKTVAKVTSTHVTCTYEDGSYCVPCVLMAC
jgi:hypothetical protein